MGTKKFIGIIVLLIGVVLIGFSIYAKGRIASAKGTVDTVTSPFSGNTAGKIIGGEAKKAASQYDTKVQMILIGGIVLAVIGGGMVLFCRKK